MLFLRGSWPDFDFAHRQELLVLDNKKNPPGTNIRAGEKAIFASLKERDGSRPRELDAGPSPHDEGWFEAYFTGVGRSAPKAGRVCADARGDFADIILCAAAAKVKGFSPNRGFCFAGVRHIRGSECGGPRKMPPSVRSKTGCPGDIPPWRHSRHLSRSCSKG